MDQNKWELKSHSWQIADTGDYDGYWEITDGKTSICTKDDPNDERLEDIVKVLNATQCKFYTNNDTELNQQLEIYLLKDENAILRAKCDKMEQALKKARPWIEANTKCVAQDIAEMSLIDLRIIDEALEQPAEPTIPQQSKDEAYDTLYRLCFSNLAKLRARCQNNERMVDMADVIRAIIEDTTEAMQSLPHPDRKDGAFRLVQSETIPQQGDKCPECGAPCIIIEKTYQEEIHDVHYVEHQYIPQQGAVTTYNPLITENELLKDLITRVHKRAINGRPVDLGMGTKQAQVLAEIEDLIERYAPQCRVDEGGEKGAKPEQEKAKYYTDEELRDIISMVCDQLNEGFDGREDFIDQTIELFASKKSAIEEWRKQGVKHPNPHLCDNRDKCGYPTCGCLPF